MSWWDRPRLPDPPPGWTTITEYKRPEPPAVPPGWVPVEPPKLIDDGYLDERVPNRIPRHEPYAGWDRTSRPISGGCAFLGLGVCLGVLLAFAVMFATAALDTTPRSGPQPEPSSAHDESRTAGVLTGVPPVPAPTPSLPAVAAPSTRARVSVPATPAHHGIATFFDVGPGYYAAAGPELRKIAGWRGSTVRVTHGDRAVLVRLSDACWCVDRHNLPTLLDLSIDAFSELADPARGIVHVEVEPPRTADDLRMQREVRDDRLYEGSQP